MLQKQFVGKKVLAELKSTYVFGLSNYPGYNSHKYSFSGMKFIYVIQVYYRMFHIENSVCGANGMCTEKHKKIHVHCSLWAEIF